MTILNAYLTMFRLHFRMTFCAVQMSYILYGLYFSSWCYLISSFVEYLVNNKLIRKKEAYFIISRLVPYHGVVFGCFLYVPYFVLDFTLA